MDVLFTLTELHNWAYIPVFADHPSRQLQGITPGFDVAGADEHLQSTR